jgi:AcrR family transcriptional regulator
VKGASQVEAVPTSPDRRTRKRVRKVDDILRATAEVLAERGYHNTSLDEIAERLDLAKASLYHYFDSKDELVSACLATCADRVSEQLTALADGEGTPTERLARMVERQIQLITLEYPEMARLFLHPLDWPPSIAAAVDERRQEHDLIFRRVIDDGVRAGEFDAGTATVARLLLHGGLNNVPQWLKSSEKNSSSVVVDAAMRLFVSDPSGRTSPRARGSSQGRT